MAERLPTVAAVALLGPTACGKSALAMRLADQFPIEIVSVDSAQVYRGMDIGTAKPSASERARLPHHLIDLRAPDEPYSAADFVRDANAAISAIRARGNLPLLVGGTMLYAKVLLEGLSALPSADPALRARIEVEARSVGWPAMHARLATLDPATAARLEPNDAQRIQRALEICTVSSRPMSALLRPARGGTDIELIALLPADRAALHRRIEERFDLMLASGFLDEVRALKASGLRPDLPSMRSVGYRQAWSHLDGLSTAEAFRAAAIAATRQLAKRQITWLRSMQQARRLDPRDPACLTDIAGILRDYWATT
jgi:tRNA dimethylallyltransferase